MLIFRNSEKLKKANTIIFNEALIVPINFPFIFRTFLLQLCILRPIFYKFNSEY